MEIEMAGEVCIDINPIPESEVSKDVPESNFSDVEGDVGADAGSLESSSPAIENIKSEVDPQSEVEIDKTNGEKTEIESTPLLREMTSDVPELSGCDAELVPGEHKQDLCPLKNVDEEEGKSQDILKEKVGQSIQPELVMESETILTPSVEDEQRRANRKKFNEMHSKFDGRCPLSSSIMLDPVVAEDGITYERANIELWFDDCAARGVPITSPATAENIGRLLKDDNSAKIKDSNGGTEPMDFDNISSIHKLRAVFAELDPLREFLSESLRGWQPPQFVVIGQESSGKSTLLERLALMPIFPRDNAFCTRMPLHVRLRHSETPKMPKMEVVNVETGKTEDGPYLVPVRWAALDVKQKMLDVLKKESDPDGVCSNRILVITVEGPTMPSIDLVDMPGLVSSPPELKEKTRLIVQKHIRLHQSYSMFLVTVPGDTSPNISIAMDVVQEMSLQDKTLGVFTMCDDIQPRKQEIFRERLRLLPSESGSNLIQRGWVATMNAPDANEIGIDPIQKLSRQALLEDEFFKSNFPDLHPDTVSCRALVHRMNEMYASHLKGTWAPTTIHMIETACESAQDLSDKMGVPEFHEDCQNAAELAVCEARQILELGLPEIVQTCFSTNLQQLQKILTAKLCKSNRFDRPEQMAAWITSQEASIINECERIASDMKHVFNSGIRKLLEASNDRPFRLCRFPAFIEAVISQSEIILHNTKEKLVSSASSYIKTFFGEMSPWVSMKIALDAGQSAVIVNCQSEVLVDNILFAFVRYLPSQSLIEGVMGASDIVETWKEACAKERIAVLNRLKRLRVAQEGIASMLGVDLNAMLEEGKQVKTVLTTQYWIE
jgi:hypothetical protein